MQIEFDITQSPGHRVSSVFIRCSDCSIPKYEPLVLTANYTIVTNDYLADGGDNFQVFKKRVKKNQLIGL